MNNLLMQMSNTLRRGGNPVNMLRQMAGRDPRMNQFMSMVDGKSPAQLRQMAENVAKERGLDINEVARSMGFVIPSER